MDFYTKYITRIYLVWISLPSIYLEYTRYGFLYQVYTQNIPGMDFFTKYIP